LCMYEIQNALLTKFLKFSFDAFLGASRRRESQGHCLR